MNYMAAPSLLYLKLNFFNWLTFLMLKEEYELLLNPSNSKTEDIMVKKSTSINSL